MVVLQQFLLSLASLSVLVFDLYFKILFAAIILSWLEVFGVVNTSNKIVRVISDVLHALTDWYFRLFRAFIPPMGNVDVSSLVALFVLYFISMFVPGLIYSIAQGL